MVGGQNQTQTAANMNQGPMTPMMMSSNMQQAGQMMVTDQNGTYGSCFPINPSLNSSVSSKLFFLEIQGGLYLIDTVLLLEETSTKLT